MTLPRRALSALHAAGAGRWRISAGQLHLDAAARRLLGERRARRSLARWLAAQPPDVAHALAQAARTADPLALTLPAPGGRVLMRGSATEGLLLPWPPGAHESADPALAHELRTPLDAIVGFTRIARAELGDASAARLLAPIDAAAQLLRRAVDQLLADGRPEPMPADADRLQPLDLAALVGRLGEIGAGLRPDGGVALYAHVDPRCPPALHGDAARLEQVLLNLLANALKYTARGRVVLEAKLLGQEAGHARLRLSVADTGAGIALDALPRLGRPFERLHGALGTQAPRVAGTGLGLALVHRLLAQLGSTLKVASVDGGGTTCWFEVALAIAEGAAAAPAAGDWGVHSDDRRFVASVATQWRARGWAPASRASGARRWIVDAAAPDAPAFAAVRRARGDAVHLASAAPREGACTLALLGARLAAPPQADAAAAASLAGLRVLLLEDNVLNQVVAADLLQRAGAQVVVVDRGAAALARAEGEHFDVALLDLHLPDGSGLDVARRLRSAPATAALPWALLTAGLSARQRREAEALGALGCLLKPVAPETLLALLQPVRQPAPSLQGMFAGLWPAQRARLVDPAGGSDLQEQVHALRGSLAVLGDAEAVALARLVEDGLCAGRPPAELPLAALVARADSLAGRKR